MEMNAFPIHEIIFYTGDECFYILKIYAFPILEMNVFPIVEIYAFSILEINAFLKRR